MERQTVDVLADEKLRDEHEAELAARDDLVSDRRANELAVARRTSQLLALVESHDGLGGDQIDHLGGVVADARALAAAFRARALGVGHRDQVIDTAQVRRRWRPRVGLTTWASGLRLAVLEVALLVDARRLTQLGVRVIEILGLSMFATARSIGGGASEHAERAEREQELRGRHLLARPGRGQELRELSL